MPALREAIDTEAVPEIKTEGTDSDGVLSAQGISISANGSAQDCLTPEANNA